jgi:Tfp pilus assembly protein PilF
MLQREILRKLVRFCYPMAFSLLLSIYWPACARCQGGVLGQERDKSGQGTATIMGEVRFPTALSTQQVLVTAQAINTGATRSVLTDSSGHFEFLGLPAGRYTISIDEGGYLPVSTTADAGDSSPPVSLSLRPSTSTETRDMTSATVSVHEMQVPEKARREFGKGVRRLDGKDPAGSLRFFNKAIQKYPKYYEAYYNLGLAQTRLGQADPALRSFQAAVDLSGGRFPLAEFAYGLLLCKQGNVNDGERTIRRGLEQDQVMAQGHLALGVAMLYRHRPEEAEHEAREALLRDSRMPDAYLVLAESHGQRNNYSAEAKDLMAYLKLEPNGPHNEYARTVLKTVQRIASEQQAQQHRQ